MHAVSPGTRTITLTKLESGVETHCTVTVLDPVAIAKAKDELAERVIAASNSLSSGKFTSESFAALKQAIDAANALIDDEYATEAQIASARVELVRAHRCLEPIDHAATEKEKERLAKEQARLQKEIARSNGMLGNERFLSKAPAAKIEEERGKLEKYTQMLAQVEEELAKLS